MSERGRRAVGVALVAALAMAGGQVAADIGPYSGPVGDLANPNPYDDPIPGYLGPDGNPSSPGITGAYINPLFIGWATGWLDYLPAPGVAPDWQNPDRALGQATADNFDIVSLGDLNQTQIDDGLPSGMLTLTLGAPITNGDGKDFAVFENGFLSTGGSGVAGEIFAELAYVEVSTDGQSFARFPSVSLTPDPVGAYGTIDATGVYNLAGKHVNAYPTADYGGCWGTPFDLDDLLTDDLVVTGVVQLTQINYVRLVDVPGSGDFLDLGPELIDPMTGQPYPESHPIYDAWLTWGSGGADIEAIGVINQMPEPGTMALLALGLAALRWRGRDGRRRA